MADKKKKEEIVLGDPMDEVIDFLALHYGKVEEEGRKVEGLDRITALKKERDKDKKSGK